MKKIIYSRDFDKFIDTETGKEITAIDLVDKINEIIETLNK